MEANKMNCSTRYCAGCYQDLRPFSNCCPPMQPCRPPCPPACPQNVCIDTTNLLFFMAGYIISKNCR